MNSESNNYDVVIVGAGMAGSLLARHLRLELPQLSVAVIEAKEDFDYGIGESTVEVFDDYAVRVLKLGPYLSANHITKHGLRFWFDSAEHDLAMEELSEQGRSRYTSLNRGIQINRATFDRDLCEMNRRMGVDVFLGTRVERADGPVFDISAEGHTIHTSAGTFRARYLVDATGRNSPLVRQLDLRDEETPVASKTSYWSRVRGSRPIDELGGESWRARVENTLRWASTNHFMYEGYWMWLIPVGDDTVSIGVTVDQDGPNPLKVRNAGEFEAFLRSHKAFDELLGEQPEFLDFMALPRIARGSRQLYSTDRWFLTGMSGLFVDPIFSSSCAHIAAGNRFILSMIGADLEGDSAKFANRVRHFNIGMRNIYRIQCSSFSQYSMFGSFDAFVNWQTLRYHSILNYEVPMQHADYAPLIREIDSHDCDCGCCERKWSPSQQLSVAGDKLTQEFVAFLREHGAYHGRNRGYYNEKTERTDTRENTLKLQFGEVQHRESQLNWKSFVRYYLVRMCDIAGVPFHPDVFEEHFEPDWNAGQTLGELLARMPATEWRAMEEDAPLWGFKGPVDAQTRESCPWWCRFIGPDGQSALTR